MRKLLFTALSAAMLLAPAASHAAGSSGIATACAAQVGVHAPLAVTYRGGVPHVVPRGPVTARHAAAINHCIAGYNAPVARNHGDVLRVGRFALVLRRARCPAVMVGGDNYCIKDPWY